MNNSKKGMFWGPKYARSTQFWEEGVSISDLVNLAARFENIETLSLNQLLLFTTVLKRAIYDHNSKNTSRSFTPAELNEKLLTWYLYEDNYDDVYDTFNKLKRGELPLFDVEEMIILLADCYKLLNRLQSK